MPMFPSKEWCEQAVRLANADAESQAAGRGWNGDFGLVVEAEPGRLARPFAVHCVPVGGQIQKFRVLVDPDDLDEIEPVYLARAPYSTWKGLLQGTVDPVEAVLRRKIQIRGDLQPIVERMRFKGIVFRVLEQMETVFVDDAGR